MFGTVVKNLPPLSLWLRRKEKPLHPTAEAKVTILEVTTHSRDRGCYFKFEISDGRIGYFTVHISADPKIRTQYPVMGIAERLLKEGCGCTATISFGPHPTKAGLISVKKLLA